MSKCVLSEISKFSDETEATSGNLIDTGLNLTGIGHGSTLCLYLVPCQAEKDYFLRFFLACKHAGHDHNVAVK